MTLSEFPLQPGSPQAFQTVRGTLLQAGFDESTLCRELKISNLSNLGKVRWREMDTTVVPEPLRQWMAVFLFGQRITRGELERSLPKPTFTAFLDLGLLRSAKADADQLVSPVFLYPVAGFLVASDRYDDPDKDSPVTQEAQPDVVFPGIFGGTLRFLELLPAATGLDVLDLCGGSGIGALCLARTAHVAVS